MAGGDENISSSMLTHWSGLHPSGLEPCLAESSGDAPRTHDFGQEPAVDRSGVGRRVSILRRARLALTALREIDVLSSGRPAFVRGSLRTLAGAALFACR